MIRPYFDQMTGGHSFAKVREPMDPTPLTAEEERLVRAAFIDGYPWDDFDALFIGGSTSWKLGPGAAAVAYDAKLRGKWVHMGRVNSLRRMRYAESIGCDSADGTTLRFSPGTDVQGWADHVRQHPSIWRTE